MKRAAFLGVIVLLVSYFDVVEGVAQERGPVVIQSNDFGLTKEQAAVGIDGRIKISLDVDEKGTVKDAEVIAGPIWPCTETPKKELNEFKSSAIANARTFRFEPALKNGKPTKSTIVLTATVGGVYKAALDNGGPVKVGNLQYVDAGVVNGRATNISKPAWPVYWSRTRSYAAEDFVISVDVIFDDQGKVVAAGTLTGPREFQVAARDAACDSKFKPGLVGEKPVLVIGRLTFTFTTRAK